MTTTVNNEPTGAHGISVGGDVQGDINQTWGDLLQFYGTGSGYRDIIVRDEIASEHVVRLVNRFAKTEKYATALGKLSDHERTVFLAGQPGSGRWATAVCLLAEVSGEERPTIRVIEPDEDTQLDLRRVQSGAHVLLDLTGTDDKTLRTIEPQIKKFVNTVAEAGGRLVVLMSGQESGDLYTDYDDRIVQLIPPVATDVASKHLDADGLRGKDVVVKAEVGALLAHASPRDAARFARLVRQEYSEVGDLDEAVKHAVTAYDDWSQDLVREYDNSGENDVEHRSLLLTVALLNDTNIEAMHQAEQRLFRLAGYQQKKENLLAGKGFAGRLSALPDTTYRAGRAWFNRRAYDGSVLRHVWSGYPELRDELVTWVTEVGEKVTLSNTEAKGMVDRFAAFCSSEGVGRPITEVARKWAESGNPLQKKMAVRLLTVGALDDGLVGPVVHRHLNDWARKSDLPRPLADVIRDVCVSQFGRVHTDKALTRLGNLADRNDAKVSSDVVTAVRTLVRDNDVLPQTLAKLAEWLAGDKVRRKVVAVQIFTALTKPGADVLDLDMLEQRDMRAPLVRVWRGVLNVDDIAVVEPTVGAWLAAAVAQPHYWAPMLDIFAEATTTDVARSGTLMMCASRWLGVSARYWSSPNSDPRVDIFNDLLARIHGAGTTSAQPVWNSDG